MEDEAKLPSQLLELFSEVGLTFLGNCHVSCCHYILFVCFFLIDSAPHGKTLSHIYTIIEQDQSKNMAAINLNISQWGGGGRLKLS